MHFNQGNAQNRRDVVGHGRPARGVNLGEDCPAQGEASLAIEIPLAVDLRNEIARIEAHAVAVDQNGSPARGDDFEGEIEKADLKLADVGNRIDGSRHLPESLHPGPVVDRGLVPHRIVRPQRVELPIPVGLVINNDGQAAGGIVMHQMEERCAAALDSIAVLEELIEISPSVDPRAVSGVPIGEPWTSVLDLDREVMFGDKLVVETDSVIRRSPNGKLRLRYGKNSSCCRSRNRNNPEVHLAAMLTQKNRSGGL